MNPRLLSLLQIIFFAGTIAVNALANALPINGLNTGEVSALYPNLFVPAGFTFSIWGIIYLLLLIYIIVSTMILVKQEKEDSAYMHVSAIAPLFVVSCILNVAWILAWHHLQTVLSLIIMLWLLRTLIGIYMKMQKTRASITGVYFLSLYIPFVVYLAWICVATIANSAALLVNIQWNAFGIEEWIWSCAMIIVAFLLSAGFAFWRGELSFALVIAWACFGIYKGQFAANETVANTAFSAVILSLIFGIWGFVRWSRKTPLEGII